MTMERIPNPGVNAFNRDVKENRGYLYTTNTRLSSVLANRRLTDAALAIADFCGKKVLDIGCGDGTYTLELFERGKAACVHGIDLAEEAVRIAREKAGSRPVTFEVRGMEALPYVRDSFDIAHVRGVLHHMDKPVDALREALRVARTVVVIEPNGYNLILKFLERFSRYHVEHKERSFAPAVLRQWICTLGGGVGAHFYAGLVPFFCPDGMAKILKRMEPLVEKIPFLNSLGCAVYVFSASRRED